MSGLSSLLRKEFMEETVSWRSAIFYLVECGVLSVFSVLLVSNTELSLLDNAQALYMMTAIVITLASLTAIVRGSDGFTREREHQTLETLLITPVKSREIAAAKLMGVFLSWLIFFLLSLPYVFVIGSAGKNICTTIRYLFIAGNLLVLTFGSLTLAASAVMRTFKGVLSIGLTIFLLSAAPIIIGPSLRQSVIGRFLDLFNPFANALNMLDSVIVDSQGFSYQHLYLVIITCYSLAALWGLYLVSRRIKL